MSLKTWVSDQLHGLVGFSDSSMAEYVCNLAATERSASSLLSKLQAHAVSIDAECSHACLIARCCACQRTNSARDRVQCIPRPSVLSGKRHQGFKRRCCDLRLCSSGCALVHGTALLSVRADFPAEAPACLPALLGPRARRVCLVLMLLSDA